MGALAVVAAYLIGGIPFGLIVVKLMTGADVRADEDSMHTYYGPSVSTHAVLYGEIPPPPAAHPFLAAIRGAKAEAASR